MNSSDDTDKESDDGTPKLPTFQAKQTEENIKGKAIINWIVGFFLILQAKYYISNAAMNLLIKFFSIVFRIIAQFSPFVGTITKGFFTSFNSMCKSIGHKESYTKYVVCPSCNHIYQFEQSTHAIGTEQYSKKCNYVKFPNHPQLIRRQPCGSLLLKTVEIVSSSEKLLLPFKMYCYQSLKISLRSLLSRQDFVSNCSLWKSQQVIDNDILDIYSGRIWKDFKQFNGVPFLDAEYSLAFILNIDWFQPYTHTQTSIGVIYLTVLNLPRYIRYKRENVILVGIIPGPHEPKHLNPYLQPLVEELLELWNGIKFPVCMSAGVKNEYVRAVILCVSCDLPAASKTCGFLGHAANLSCIKCLKVSPGGIGCKDYSGFDRSSWPKRDNHQHRRAVQKIRTQTTQKEMESKMGCRYSCLLDLPYFDATRMLCIDPMHNLLLGTGKHMLSLWIDQGWIEKRHFISIQKFVDNLILPSRIGRIPKKIESAFSGFKADQFKSWIIIYSIPALYSILPTEHLECWRHFVLACRILCKQRLSMIEIDLADILLLRFCKRVQELYGRNAITPNMHLHCHLKEILLDFGPVQEFWLFSFERYNGILGNQPTNNRAIEEQLMKRFIRDNLIYSFNFPDEFRNEFATVLVADELVGSVGDIFTMPTKLVLPNNYTRNALDADTMAIVKDLIKKINQVPDVGHIHVNTIYLQYSSVTLEGKIFSSSIGQHRSPCIVQVQWNEDYYGNPPTELPEPSEPRSNIRPVRLHNYLKVNYSVNSEPSSLILAFVSWMKPHQLRYHIGKPAELWRDRFEVFGMHSFIPIHSIICHCAYGTFCYNDEDLVVVIPLV